LFCREIKILLLSQYCTELNISCFWQKSIITVKARKKKGTIAKSQSAPSKVGESKDESEITGSDIYREPEDPCNSTRGMYGCNAQFEHSNWRVQWDDFYQRYYFYNVQSEESTWDPPPGFENYNILHETLDEIDISGMSFFLSFSN
jgi:WW domain